MLGHVAFISMDPDLCHWVLDKAFQEDLNQTCQGNAANNSSLSGLISLPLPSCRRNNTTNY
jgi:hypothetical protein